jgi:hypothetical protein
VAKFPATGCHPMRAPQLSCSPIGCEDNRYQEQAIVGVSAVTLLDKKSLEELR